MTIATKSGRNIRDCVVTSVNGGSDRGGAVESTVRRCAIAWLSVASVLRGTIAVLIVIARVVGCVAAIAAALVAVAGGAVSRVVPGTVLGMLVAVSAVGGIRVGVRLLPAVVIVIVSGDGCVGERSALAAGVVQFLREVGRGNAVARVVIACSGTVAGGGSDLMVNLVVMGVNLQVAMLVQLACLHGRVVFVVLEDRIVGSKVTILVSVWAAEARAVVTRVA